MIRPGTLVRVAVSALVVGSAASCSSAEKSGPAVPFVAFSSDFAGYHGWEAFPLSIDIAPGNDHLNGPRTVYLKARPPAGSTDFPVGTILVKESGTGDPATRHVFAMVKRGADFNPTGAHDWEWFELADAPNDTVSITWRGVGPANGDAYGGDATGGCNSCHATAASSDYVFTGEETALIGK